jgi:hypothetical protein
VVFFQKKCNENELDEKVKLNPIAALQKLCAFHQRTMPQYKFFEISGHLFAPECTVMMCMVKGRQLI